jgi:DNA-binding NarL/FixJ family response regulator
LILVFGLHLDLAVAQEALHAGARGFIHAGMKPKQIVRAVTVALEGEIVAPRQLLGYLVSNGDVKDLGILSAASGKFWSSLVRALLMPK